MKNTNHNLTLDICTEDGSRTRFHQTDEQLIAKTLRQLVTARLFNQAMLTLGSEHSVSAIPTNSIDMIMAYTTSPPPLPLPSGWLEAVEVNDNTLLDLADLREAAAAEGRNVMLAEIHTFGDWMIRLKLETVVPATIQEERQLWDVYEKQAMDKAKAAGIEIIQVSAADKKAFQDAVKPVWDKYGPKYADMVKRIQDTK